MCWEKQIIYTDCHHSVFEDIDCADYKTQQARKLNPHDSSFTSSSSVNSAGSARNHHHHQLNTSSANNAKRARRTRNPRSPWMFLLCLCFPCPSTPSTPPPPQAHEESGVCRGRKRCMSPVGGKCPRCVQDKAVAAMQAVPPSTPTLARTRYQQQRRPELGGNNGMNDTYGVPGASGDRNRGQKAPRRGDTVRRYQDSGAPGQPTGGHEGNGTRRDGGNADGRSGGGGVAGAVEHSSRGGRSPTSPWFNKRFHDARGEEASQQQQHRRGEQQGAQQAHLHQRPQEQRIPVSHDGQRQQQQQHQLQKRPSGLTSPLPTQPEPIPSYVRGSTFHLLPAPLKIKKKKSKQETSPRAVEGTADMSEGLTRSSASVGRPLQVNATHQTGEQRSSRDQQQGDHRAVVSSSEPRITEAKCTPELPLEELMDEVEMLWRRVPN
ncbi:uncharacterized protein CCOS01_07972 [Colletotrichum costaricense]|uniref:Uncharacterized protein n=1 Tax=Colletotrichum costaricense TaxID=1209916 RepID=A0AAI9YYY8_9PEZI|nr:uncharacterized protein CCOS01_07972 [Colletotrichum costaricense]KAK1527710.1 hypothetical protein CCOS01_07972 [Colletotrichum costaricense]